MSADFPGFALEQIYKLAKFVIVGASFEGWQDSKAWVGLYRTDIEDVKTKHGAGHGNMKQSVDVLNKKLAFCAHRLNPSPRGTPGDN